MEPTEKKGEAKHYGLELAPGKFEIKFANILGSEPPKPVASKPVELPEVAKRV